MEKLKLPATSISGSPASQPGSGVVRRAPNQNAPLPKIYNRLTDVEIPNRVWSAWIPAADTRQLCRALTAHERAALEARRTELLPAVDGYHPTEQDRVVVALAEMFSGFGSMRHSGDEAVGKVESVCRFLAGFPCWAIEKACTSIRMNGVWRDGKFDRQWPPSDAELAKAVRDEFRLYADQYRSAVALLAATVEER